MHWLSKLDTSNPNMSWTLEVSSKCMDDLEVVTESECGPNLRACLLSCGCFLSAFLRTNEFRFFFFAHRSIKKFIENAFPLFEGLSYCRGGVETWNPYFHQRGPPSNFIFTNCGLWRNFLLFLRLRQCHSVIKHVPRNSHWMSFHHKLPLIYLHVQKI